MNSIDLKHTENWIKRYLNADMTVNRRILADIREVIGVELTREQYQVLGLIHHFERCTSTFLADFLFVGKSSITSIINRLAERNLVERTRDSTDRRVVYLTLTEEGRSVYEQTELQVQSIVSSYLTHFDEDEVDLFITLYEKLANLMQDYERGAKE
ncbi:MarR family winged helix-turn-helix transcriptional regulator [Paenibacillus faecalis]|uniref:MarR family winged helix-turn-helix transcriptional regulator n=1 Tax=Paenibacillus faecalis TaxID=2079532 RepID=UPI001F1B0F91|nr:MarR family transcriptional regulator [Paenibacillus faecalis]